MRAGAAAGGGAAATADVMIIIIMITTTVTAITTFTTRITHPGILATLPDESRYGENRGKKSCLRRKQWEKCCCPPIRCCHQVSMTLAYFSPQWPHQYP